MSDSIVQFFSDIIIAKAIFKAEIKFVLSPQADGSPNATSLTIMPRRSPRQNKGQLSTTEPPAAPSAATAGDQSSVKRPRNEKVDNEQPRQDPVHVIPIQDAGQPRTLPQADINPYARRRLTVNDAPRSVLNDFGYGLKVQDGWTHHASVLHTITSPDGFFVDAYIERRSDGKKRKINRKEDIEDIAISLNHDGFRYPGDGSTQWARP